VTGITGSCLCGAVRYEATGPAGPMVHCHCRTCRKAHGTAFSTIYDEIDAIATWVTANHVGRIEIR
jgi:hypothetical protein